MKLIKFSIAFMMVLSLASCKEKQEENQNEKETVVEEVKNLPFTVTANVTAQKDDVFQVYYNEDGTDIFTAEQAITLTFTGSESAQDLVFNFEGGISPLALRFDIGANVDMKAIKINSFTIEYKDKKVKIEGSDLSKYFRPTEQVKYDSSTNTATIDYKQGELYDPLFVPTQEQKEMLAKLYSSN